MNSKYENALEVAKYIVAVDSMLYGQQLEELLFFAQNAYISQTGELLFPDEFHKTEDGFTIPGVASKIRNEFDARRLARKSTIVRTDMYLEAYITLFKENPQVFAEPYRILKEQFTGDVVPNEFFLNALT